MNEGRRKKNTGLGKKTEGLHPRDLMQRDFPDLAELLRANADIDHAERRLRGVSARTLRMAADTLDATAAGRNPTKELFDGRNNEMTSEHAVLVVLHAAFSGATGWADARDKAAGALRLDLRTIERHWQNYLKKKGIAEEDYLFPG